MCMVVLGRYGVIDLHFNTSACTNDVYFVGFVCVNMVNLLPANDAYMHHGTSLFSIRP